jgi:hypothetical protein
MGPEGAILDPGLSVAWEEFRPLGFGEAEVIRDRAPQGGEGALLAYSGAKEERE